MTTLNVHDSPKMLRETLCVAQAAIGEQQLGDRRREHIARLQRLINECERHRPTGPDGKHDDRHTTTCGCEDAPPAPPEFGPATEPGDVDPDAIWARTEPATSAALLAAYRAIPDGPIHHGCVVSDGAQVKAAIRAAYQVLHGDLPPLLARVRQLEADLVDAAREIGRQVGARSHAEARLAAVVEKLEQPEATAAGEQWRDPTHGRIDADIQAAVDDMEPQTLGQRVAFENTFQDQRDRRLGSPLVRLFGRSGFLVRISNSDEVDLVTIGYDGQVNFPPGVNLEEPARLWWDAVAATFGHHELGRAIARGRLVTSLSWPSGENGRPGAEDLGAALGPHGLTVTEVDTGTDEHEYQISGPDPFPAAGEGRRWPWSRLAA